MGAERFDGVIGAGGLKATVSAHDRSERDLVEPDEGNERPGGEAYCRVGG